MIAALYVCHDGPYFGRAGVDPWPEERDARTYAGPHPVVAHPPCATWCRLWKRTGRAKGDDDGCFAAALAAVRRWGGVLEHPADSGAWAAHGLPQPAEGAWTQGILDPGWSTEIRQSTYGHRAEKRTWLYYVGPPPPPLLWNVREPVRQPVNNMDTTERRRTPPAFADLLISLAARAQVEGAR